MTQKKEQYLKDGIPELTGDDILKQGNKIVAMPLVPTVWQQITKKPYSRGSALQARAKGRIHPMGFYRGRLYFWRSEVEHAALNAKPRLTDEERETRRKRKKKAISQQSEKS